MPFIGNTSINNLQVDGVYVNVLSPTPNAGIGVPTNLGGIVGTGSWGPLNTPTPFSDMGSLYLAFGKQTLDTNNLVTEGQFAVGYGNNFLGVRVSDGTDVAASVHVMDSATASGMTLAAKYTGTVGNSIAYAVASGSNTVAGALTYTLTISATGYPTETYRNIVGGATGSSFWANATAAINNGQGTMRPASSLVVATAGSSSNPPALASGSLAGGTNGSSSLTPTQLLGTDGAIGARSGVYALRGTGVDTVILAGDTTSTNWTAMASFAASEACLALTCIPTGTSVAASVSSKNTAGLASVYAAIAKDFVYFTDAVNGGQKRLVSPLGAILGHICSLPPEASPGNKPRFGFNILGTEQLNNQYSYSDSATLQPAGILYITNQNGVYKLAHGQNSSMILGQDNIAYTRMTNYLSKSIGGLLQPFVDELQGTKPQDPTRLAAGGVLTGFLQQLQDGNRISSYGVQMDLKNNTALTIGEGLLIALIQVQYMSVIRFFLAQLQGGQMQIVTASSIN